MADLTTVIGISFLAGAATGLGALPALLTARVSHRVYDAALGLAGGIMIGASMFTLIIPGLELGTLAEVGIGILIGGAFLLGANRLIPHVHVGVRDDPLGEKAVLVASAITLHNIPEGLAVGIAFGSGLDGVGIALAAAIAIQNVPDGFAVAVPASRTDLSRWKTLLYTTMSGGVPEPVAAVIGFLLVSTVTELFPLAAGIAAGAMMAVVSREMIPDSHGHGFSDAATATFIAGFVAMMIIDTLFTV